MSEAELKRQTFLGTRDWKAYPPTVDEVKAWRQSMRRLAERRIMMSWTGPGWVRISHMIAAEKRYKALGLI